MHNINVSLEQARQILRMKRLRYEEEWHKVKNLGIEVNDWELIVKELERRAKTQED